MYTQSRDNIIIDELDIGYKRKSLESLENFDLSKWKPKVLSTGRKRTGVERLRVANQDSSL